MLRLDHGEFCDGRIQFSAGWITDGFNADDLIGRADVFEGLPFARLEDVLLYKQALGRPKDFPDIRAIQCVLRRSR
jgi:hypothetical protein